jgi:hypothetical protein
MMTQRTLLVLSDWRPDCDISYFRRNYTVVRRVRQATDFGWRSNEQGEDADMLPAGK